jgi:hypothetical protein
MWTIILTVCTMTTCLEQEVRTGFETRETCSEVLQLYREVPSNGDWKSVEYKCVILGAKEV